MRKKLALPSTVTCSVMKDVREKTWERARIWVSERSNPPANPHPHLFKQSIKPARQISVPQISKDDKVLVFMGSVGDVSRHLPGRKIHFDADPKAIRIAQWRAQGAKDTHFLVGDATNPPIKRGKVDWAFSHEPDLPRPTSQLTMLEMLSTAKKGVIISEGHNSHIGDYHLILEFYRRLYSHEAPPIERAHQPVPGSESEGMAVSVLRSTKEMRERAETDLGVLRALEKRQELYSEKEYEFRHLKEKDLEVLAQRLGITRDAMTASLKRLKALKFVHF
ncbi:MAG TPA: class I SAM-dependent methyltransferase [archaeon]|nr:class I SAM-dependent methyltransferase [archaeon]